MFRFALHRPFFLRSLALFLFIFTPFLSIASVEAGNNKPSDGRTQILSGVNATAANTDLKQTTQGADLQTLIGRIVGSVLSLIGLLFFVLTVYGGFLWMTAHGHEDIIEKGKNTIIQAIIGMVIVFSAYAITRFVLGSADSVNEPTQDKNTCETNSADGCSGKSFGAACTYQVEDEDVSGTCIHDTAAKTCECN